MLPRKVDLDQISALLLASCVVQGMFLSQVSFLMSVKGRLYHHPPGMLGRFSGNMYVRCSALTKPRKCYKTVMDCDKCDPVQRLFSSGAGIC